MNQSQQTPAGPEGVSSEDRYSGFLLQAPVVTRLQGLTRPSPAGRKRGAVVVSCLFVEVLCVCRGFYFLQRFCVFVGGFIIFRGFVFDEVLFFCGSFVSLWKFLLFQSVCEFVEVL